MAGRVPDHAPGQPVRFLHDCPSFGAYDRNVLLPPGGPSGTLLSAATGGVAADHRGAGTIEEAGVDRVRSREALLEDLAGSEDAVGSLRGRLLRTREVALLFQVSERAVTDWARRGRIPSVRTPGGHRRYPADEVWALLRRSEAGDQAID